MCSFDISVIAGAFWTGRGSLRSRSERRDCIANVKRTGIERRTGPRDLTAYAAGIHAPPNEDFVGRSGESRQMIERVSFRRGVDDEVASGEGSVDITSFRI